MSIGFSSEIGNGVPTSLMNSKSLNPSPNRYTPIPLIPCSAFNVTLMKAVMTPITTPTPIPARTP